MVFDFCTILKQAFKFLMKYDTMIGYVVSWYESIMVATRKNIKRGIL